MQLARFASKKELAGAVSALKDTLSDRDATVRSYAAFALYAQTGKLPTSTLIAAYTQLRALPSSGRSSRDHLALRGRILEHLAKSRSAAAHDIVIDAIANRRYELRYAAVRSLSANRALAMRRYRPCESCSSAITPRPRAVSPGTSTRARSKSAAFGHLDRRVEIERARRAFGQHLGARRPRQKGDSGDDCLAEGGSRRLRKGCSSSRLRCFEKNLQIG
jgi:hypothetical protein